MLAAHCLTFVYIFSMTEFNLHEKLESSRAILLEALNRKPYRTIVAFSGGDDSVTVMEVLKHFGVKPHFAIHADTLTGMPAAKEFVKIYCRQNNIPLLITTPKKTLSDMVEKDGFLGVGKSAHRLAFGELKGKPIRDKISEVIRQGKRGREIVIFSGVRRNESNERKRSKKYENPFWQEKTGNKKDGVATFSPDIWTALILHWEKEDCLEFLEWKKVKRNPISVKYGRSGDCHCGTAIAEPEREFLQLMADAPDVAKEIEHLNQYCIDRHLTQWCQPRNKYNHLESNGQCNLFDGLDLCSGCQNKFEIATAKRRFLSGV